MLWKDYPVTEASWEPESNLQHALEILEDYLRRIATVDRKRVRTRKGKFDQVMVLPGSYRANALLLGWVRLVLRHTMWREIAYGVPNSRAVSVGCSCASSRVEQKLLMLVPGALISISLGM